ncbi:MAG: hypothetical protein ACN2B6_08120 [Rickettsiales bacterium]
MAMDPSGMMHPSDGSAMLAPDDASLHKLHGDGRLEADDGGMHAAAQTQSNGGRSPSVLTRASAEFLGALGFVSMFAAIGGTLIPALTAGFTAVTVATIAVAVTVGITSMIGAAAIRKHMENVKSSSQNMQPTSSQGKEPSQVIINNVQLQPNVDVEAQANFFTKMIEAERNQQHTPERG